MTKTIWKFTFETKDIVVLALPKGAKILTIQTQFNEPTIWALVDSEAPEEKRAFAIYGTGHPFPETYRQDYIGTYQLDGGNYVFHVFEIINP